MFFFKQKTAYEMRISDWSSDVCSSDLQGRRLEDDAGIVPRAGHPGAVDGDLPAAQRQQANDHPQQGRLDATGGTDQGDELAIADGMRGVIQRNDLLAVTSREHI